MTNFKVGIGNNIKLLRKSAGITQEELAEIVGIHSRQLSKIETGEHFPSCKTLEKICMALDVEPRMLFDFEFLSEENESVLTGTDNTTVFKLERKTEAKDNVYRLRSGSKNINPSLKTCTDESMAKIAKTLNRPVFAEYYSNGKSTKIVVFYPDGREKIVKNNDDVEEKQNMIYMMKEIKKIAKDKASIDFLKTALNALNDNDELKKLDIIVDGMKLARKIN